MSGIKYSRLNVIDISHRRKGVIYWNVICDCGIRKVCNGRDIRRGDTTSCGCYNAETTSKLFKKHGEGADGFSKLYAVWKTMRMRCLNKNDKNYMNYGGRGIIICSEWMEKYKAFRDWALISGYKDGLSIDRINNNEGYSPENCRWTNRVEQARNRRIPSNNKTGVLGVVHRKGKYAVSIGLNYKKIHIGTYETLEQAKKARENAEKKFYINESIILEK